jgi:hypothetical protein
MLSYRAIEAMRGATRWFEALGERFRSHVDVDGVDLVERERADAAGGTEA